MLKDNFTEPMTCFIDISAFNSEVFVKVLGLALSRSGVVADLARANDGYRLRYCND